MKYQNTNIFRTTSFCLTILFLGLMIVTFANAQTENYTFVKACGSWGSGAGQFLGPIELAKDSSVNVYVADSGNCRAQEFDNNGNYIMESMY